MLLSKKHWGAMAPQLDIHELVGSIAAYPLSHGYATDIDTYFLFFSEVGEALALPDGCSAVLVGGTCGINGLIR
jgi:hypothetical protein